MAVLAEAPTDWRTGATRWVIPTEVPKAPGVSDHANSRWVIEIFLA